MLVFFAGIAAGVVIGVAIMALFAVSSDADKKADYMFKERRKRQDPGSWAV